MGDELCMSAKLGVVSEVAAKLATRNRSELDAGAVEPRA